MTDKELRKLSRSDLLEILTEQSREIDNLKAETERLRGELKNKTIQIRNSGSIAEAAMKLNGVFEAAQNAAQQYIENVRRLDSEHGLFVESQRRRLDDAEKAVLRDAYQKADGIIKSAEAEAERILKEAGSAAGASGKSGEDTDGGGASGDKSDGGASGSGNGNT